MVVRISDALADALRQQAQVEARGLDELVDDALREYLISLSITDISPDQIGEAQMVISSELKVPPYDGGPEEPHEAR